MRRPLKQQRERKKGVTAGDRTQGLWLEPIYIHRYIDPIAKYVRIGRPVHWTPHAVITFNIHYDQQLHTAIIQYNPQQSLKSRAINGKERGLAVGGCRSSVAEHWRLKPVALGSIPGGATFLSLCRWCKI